MTLVKTVTAVTVVTVDRNKHVCETLEPFVSAIGIIRILFSPCFDILLDSFVHAAWLAQTNWLLRFCQKYLCPKEASLMAGWLIGTVMKVLTKPNLASLQWQRSVSIVIFFKTIFLETKASPRSCVNQGWSLHPEVLFHSNYGYSKE